VGQQRQVNCIKPGLRKKRSFSFQPIYYTLLFDYYRIMEMKEAVRALAAIGHESRLIVYRLLVQAGPAGLAAGEIAQKAGMPPSSLSFHLKELVHAGLLTFRQEGRFVIYAAQFETMATLLNYLTENCCDGEPCLPALLSTTCAPIKTERPSSSKRVASHD
jgi:ArsR family transcriptional regulator